MNNVIAVKNLNKKFPKFALSDISFEIPEGCVAGFIGLNGQGKTTTIRTILGLSKKLSGKVEILGKDFDSHEKELKNQIGLVFDEGYLYEDLQMKDMKKIVARAYSQWDETQYRTFMTRFGLDENQVIATLSKGMRMKFALALALSHHAKLLIMDEPTSGLDPLVRQELLEILKDYMAEDGVGILYSSHITSDLDKFADMIIFIDKGHILFAEDKDYLIENHMRVKGDCSALTEENRALFIYLEENTYGFTGVTKEADCLKQQIPNLICERINIETLMIAYIERGKQHA